MLDLLKVGHLPNLLCGLLHYTMGFMAWVLVGNRTQGSMQMNRARCHTNL